MSLAGNEINDLASQFGISRTTVMKHEERACVTRRRGVILEHLDEARRLYEEGWSLAKARASRLSFRGAGSAFPHTHRARSRSVTSGLVPPNVCQGCEHLVGSGEVPEVALSRTHGEFDVGE